TTSRKITPRSASGSRREPAASPVAPRTECAGIARGESAQTADTTPLQHAQCVQGGRSAGYEPRLLHVEPLACGRRFLGELELEHTLVVAGFALRSVKLGRQGDAAKRVAVKALHAQHALPVLHFLFALDLGARRHLFALDGDLDVVLAYAWNFGVNGVRLVVFGDIYLDGQRGRPALHAN